MAIGVCLVEIIELYGVSGDDDDTGGNETEDDDSEGNLITGLFTAQPSQAIASFFEGVISWFASLF